VAALKDDEAAERLEEIQKAKETQAQPGAGPAEASPASSPKH